MLKNFRPKNTKQTDSKKRLPIFQFHSLQKFSDEVDHAVLSRSGGVSQKPFESLNLSLTVDDKAEDVLKNRALVCEAFGLAEERLISANQTHSKNVQIVDEAFLLDRKKNEDVENIDAFITNVRGVGLMVKVADCQSILMFDPVQKVVAAVHAGWKGLKQNISAETIGILKKNYGVNPENLIVAIGPSLGPCCSFFSNPHVELSSDFEPYIAKNNTVDLWEFSTQQLVKLGVQPDKIEHARVCTMCGGGEKFFSFRRDRGVTGRFGALIILQ